MSGLPGYFTKVLVVKRKRWTYRIVYELRGESVVVHYIDSSWVRRPPAYQSRRR